MLVSAIGVGLFMVTSLAVSVRLLRLWRLTRLLPELLLGVALLFTGFFGFALEMGAKLALALGDQTRFTLLLFGLAAEYVGSVALLLFARRVFHPRARWAAALAWGLGLLLLVGLAGEWLSGQYLRYVDDRPIVGAWVPLGIAARGLAPLWMAAECFRYHGMLRRRLELGLAEPLVVHRVALWGAATGGSALGHAVSVYHRIAWGTGLEAHAWSLNLVAALAFVSAVCLGLAFFPPRPYRRWMHKSA